MAPSASPLQSLLNAPDAAHREHAWSEFLAAYSPLLLHVARTSARDQDTALDAYAFILGELRRNEFQRLRSFTDDGRSKLSTWLVVVARRLCADHDRREHGRGRAVQSTTAHQEQLFRRRLSALIGEDVELTELAAAHLDAGEQLRADELRVALQSALESLPPSDRLLVTLRFEDDLPAQQIAQILRLPTPFHVYRRLETVTNTLRKLLALRGVEEAAP